MLKENWFILKLPVAFMLVFSIIMLCAVSVDSSAQMGTWTKKADMPTPRFGLSSSVVNGKIYAIGGYLSDLTGMGTVESYDPATNMWKKKSDMPTPRLVLSTSVVNGKIYAIGGYANGRLSIVEEYDPATDTWTKKANMLTPKHWLTTCVVNGKIYAISGYNSPDVQEYDPVTDTWTKKADMPDSRWGLSSGVVDGKIYIFGGGINAIQMYDPITNIWTKKSNMLTPRQWIANSSPSVNGKIYVIGGWKYHDANTIGPGFSEVEEYNPVTDTWVSKPDMLTPRGSLGCSEINGKIYAIGGADGGSTLSTVEVYDTGFDMEVKAISTQEAYTTGGTPIAISGSKFLSDLIVTIGDKPLSDQKVTYNLITGTIPPNTEGEKDIVFTLPSFNYSTVVDKFFYRSLSNITVTKITPNNGKQAGRDVVSLAGSGFLPGAIVTIGGIPATNVGVTPTLITFTMPPGTEGTKDVVATNPDGQKSILRNAYTYNPFPIIE
ncbi:MAG: IPT/TIG domain-containing protein, partial [Candidatus Poribacteria bacterium]